ncbi:MAG: succinate dehydrogenase, cytochrome b556 subunit [Woeseiaceae bacterium]
MSNTERPLSPHLSIYRWPITMTLSILHRITGVALSVGLILLAYWLVTVASGGADYDQLNALLATLVGRACLIGWTFAFFLHLANGVRHLVWDVGRGFEIKQVDASAWFVLILAIVLTTVFWVLL